MRTFHSFALSVVRRHPGPLGLPAAGDHGDGRAVGARLGAPRRGGAAEWGLSPGAFDRPATVREVYDLSPRCQEHLLGTREDEGLGEKTGRPYLVRAGASSRGIVDASAGSRRWTTRGSSSTL